MRAAVILLCLVLLVSPGLASAQDSSVRLPAFSKFKLPNGMTLLLMEQHEVPIISVNVIIKEAGALYDIDKGGLAALTADLLRKGTRTRSAEVIAGDLDFLGASFDMSATTDYTGGSAEFLKKDMRQGLDLFADILRNPVFPEDEVTKLIKQRIDGIKSSKDRADRVISRYFHSYLYAQQGRYGRPVEGDELTLAGIKRQDIQSFHQQHYFPGNVILAVAGDFATAEMRALLEERFGSWTRSGGGFALDTFLRRAPTESRRLLLVDKPDSTQTYFYVGSFGISRTNPDRVAIAVINTLFGGRFTSKLNTALRVDSGLTYGARSVFEQNAEPGPFFITSFTRNATTERALDMTLEVLKKFHEEGITQAELDSAKTYLKGQFPPTLETSDRLASTIAQLEFYGLNESDVNSYSGKVDAVTLEEARRIIGKYFPLENLVFVLIGKASEIREIVSKYAPVIEQKSINEPGF